MRSLTKSEFLDKLKKALPKDEREERIAFYSEAIDDRIEDGLSEEEAVAAMGNIDEIIFVAPMKKERRSFRAWEILLLVLGAPLWIPLVISAFAVVLSLYVVLWSVMISLWAVFASLLGCAFGIIFGGAIFAFSGLPLVGAAMIGVGLVCAGLAIFMFFGCKAATKGTAALTKAVFRIRRAKR